MPKVGATGRLPRAPGGAQPAATDAGQREPAGAIPRATTGSGVAAAFDQLSLENVHISDGTLRFPDERNGALKEITAITENLSLVDLAGPFRAKAALLGRARRSPSTASCRRRARSLVNSAGGLHWR